jgi:hypothetical protein
MGLWGTGFLESGVNKDYLDFVKSQIVKSIESATAEQQPVRIKYAQDLYGLAALVTDTRKPLVMDEGLRVMQIVHSDTDKTLGTLIGWANHPETSPIIHKEIQRMIKDYYDKNSLN